jgi:hypothetical protein
VGKHTSQSSAFSARPSAPDTQSSPHAWWEQPAAPEQKLATQEQLTIQELLAMQEILMLERAGLDEDDG